MGEVSHTNPETGETFGDSQVYQRGRVAVVDGGSAGSKAKDAEEDADEEPMGEVDHTPREDAPSTNEVYTRGDEGAAEEEEEAGEDAV